MNLKIISFLVVGNARKVFVTVSVWKYCSRDYFKGRSLRGCCFADPGRKKLTRIQQQCQAAHRHRPARCTSICHLRHRVRRELVGSLKKNTTLEYSTRVVQEGDRRCEKSTLNDLAYLTPLRIPLMNPVSVWTECEMLKRSVTGSARYWDNLTKQEKSDTVRNLE